MRNVILGSVLLAAISASAQNNSCVSNASTQELLGELALRGVQCTPAPQPNFRVSAQCQRVDRIIITIANLNTGKTIVDELVTHVAWCPIETAQINAAATRLQRGGRMAACFNNYVNIKTLTPDGRVVDSSMPQNNEHDCHNVARDINAGG